MSRNEHGAYGPRYEGAVNANVAGGHAAQPPHTGMEQPLAPAPHAGGIRTHFSGGTPSFPAMLTFFAVLLGVLCMFWPSYRLVSTFENDDQFVNKVWVHGSTSQEFQGITTTVLRPVGLLLLILLMLWAVAGALVAWLGRSVRADAFGLFGVAVYTGAILLPSLMALTADVGLPSGIEMHYDVGVWLGIAASVCGLVASILFFTQLGRRAPRRVHD